MACRITVSLSAKWSFLWNRPYDTRDSVPVVKGLVELEVPVVKGLVELEVAVVKGLVELEVAVVNELEATSV